MLGAGLGAGLQVATPAPRSVWRELLAADPTATVQQTPEWVDAICSVDPYRDASRLYVTDTGRQFVLPLVSRTRLPDRTRVLKSLPPPWGTSGLVAAGGTTSDDVEAVWRDLAGLSIAHGWVRPYYQAAAAWDAVAPPAGVVTRRRTNHVLDLEGGAERVWSQRFEGSVRRAVRKAERSGLEVECDTTGRLASVYHELFVGWTARQAAEKGLPPVVQQWRAERREPPRKYAVLAPMLGGACRIWVARLDGRPAAALVVLVYGQHAHYWRGYSDKTLAGPSRANNLLHWLAIQDACRAGCRWYDMGLSGDKTSLADFKSRHGAVPYDYPEYIIGWPLLARSWEGRRHLRRRLGRIVTRRG
jgi:CelD/BcsL family acetyltransferase involved in cellulose biosynthesis